MNEFQYTKYNSTVKLFREYTF